MGPNCRGIHARRVAGLLLALAGIVSAAAQDTLPLRRYGVFVGANDGGGDRVKLLYAESDSRSVAQVMRELGGMDPRDAMILVDPSVAEVMDALATMGERIRVDRASVRRAEFVLYYSGHSDEQALLLGSERLGYRDIRDAMAGMGADISIAILDSCASGAFIRMKGGQRTAPFLVDESSTMQGQVYLTSSSENEASQESDALGGSFFTHSLVAGLRGAADFSMDQKITLHEAYQYANAETLARTENTQAGPQHPSWYINLIGTGDLVLTDLRSTSAGLTMSEGMSGKVYIRDEEGKLVAEIRKSAGAPLTLALPPGSYTVVASSPDRVLEARIVLSDGKWSDLNASDFRDAPRVATRSRGDAEGAGVATADSEEEYAARARELVQGSWTSGDEPEAAPLGSGQEESNGFFEKLGRALDERVPRKVQELLDGTTVGAPNPPPTPAPRDETDTEWARPESESAEERPFVPLSLGLVPGLSFPPAGQSPKGISLNAIMGISYSIDGFEASGIMNITSHHVHGAQVAGVGNIVEEEVAGYQGGGVFNVAGGKLSGVQSGGVFNIAEKGGGIVQAAGVFNMSEGAFSGVQMSGVFNTAATLDGAQLSGVFSMVQGDARGVQASGVFSYAGAIRGAQLGVANVAGEVQGAQVGVVNIGSQVRGVQVGVVNVASSLRGLPVGLINIVGDGLFLVSLSRDEKGFAELDLVSGRGLYTLLSGGVLLDPDGRPVAASSAAGLGMHLPLGPFFVEADAAARNTFSVLPDASYRTTDLIPYPSVRGRVGMLFFGRVGGFLGYSVDVHLGQGFPMNSYAHAGTSTQVTVGDQVLTLYPRFTSGISVGRQPGTR